MKGITMPNTTRRVRAGTEPPPDMPIQFAKGYEDDHPSNLRWATRSENVRNLRKPSARAAIAKVEGEKT